MILFTAISSNAKTGPIPVSGSQAETCPSACPFSPKDGKPNGCYAAYGPISWHWKKLNNGVIGFQWNDFLKKIKDLPRNSLWRHNQFGDLQGKDNDIDAKALAELVEANKGRNGFTYTHKPVLNNLANRNAVENANKNGFTVNLSANNLDNADELKALKIAPVATIVPLNSPNVIFTKGGNKVIVCPAQTRDNINCAKCKLCQNSKRSVIIGFKAHGVGTKKVEAVSNL
jgi:hypothetical protein